MHPIRLLTNALIISVLLLASAGWSWAADLVGLWTGTVERTLCGEKTDTSLNARLFITEAPGKLAGLKSSLSGFFGQNQSQPSADKVVGDLSITGPTLKYEGGFSGTLEKEGQISGMLTSSASLTSWPGSTTESAISWIYLTPADNKLKIKLNRLAQCTGKAGLGESLEGELSKYK